MRKVKFLLLSTLVGLSLICLIMLFRSGGIAYDPRQIIDSMPQNVDMQLSGVQFHRSDRKSEGMDFGSGHASLSAGRESHGFQPGQGRFLRA